MFVAEHHPGRAEQSQQHTDCHVYIPGSPQPPSKAERSIHHFHSRALSSLSQCHSWISHSCSRRLGHSPFSGFRYGMRCSWERPGMCCGSGKADPYVFHTRRSCCPKESPRTSPAGAVCCWCVWMKRCLFLPPVLASCPKTNCPPLGGTLEMLKQISHK